MPTYLARMNAEYTLSVEAESLEEAQRIAGYTDVDDWEVAWSNIEIDEYETTIE